MRRLGLIAALAVIVGLAAAASPASAVGGRAVYDRDHADPEIIRADDGRYYTYATSRRRGTVRQNVPVMSSTDLVSWTELGDAAPVLGSWVGSGPVWAPSVAPIADQYVLFYSAPRAGVSPRQMCIGRAVAGSPLGPFVDRWRTALICPHDGAFEVIDPSVFVDHDGRSYLHYKTSTLVDGHNTTRVWSVALTPDALDLVAAPVPLLDATLAWEEGGVENAEMVLVEGRYWLLYSGSWWDTDRYATGVAVCRGPQGPCTKQGRLLEADDARRGPGGASVVQDRAGGWWIAYHAWVGRTRVLFVDGIVFGERMIEIDSSRLTPRTLPVAGALDLVATYGSYVRVKGWAADGDDSLPVGVEVTADGSLVRSVLADDFRPDRRGPFGFDLYVPAAALGRARVDVCAFALDDGAARVALGCRTVSLSGLS